MSCFPFFMELEGKSILIAGGGRVALGKIEKLLPYGPHLTVAAPEIAQEIAVLPGLRLLRRHFRPEDLEGADFAIAATSNRKTDSQIAALCREKGIPVNAADNPEACTFLFPALVKRGSLTIGISTGGASPTAAVWLKEQIATLLPDRLEEILDFLYDLRPGIKALLPEEKARARAFSGLFHRCLDAGRPLTVSETEAYLGLLAEEREDI